MGSACSIGSEKAVIRAVIDTKASGCHPQPNTFICRNAIAAKSESQLQDNTKATERNRRSRRTQSKHRESHDDVTTSEYRTRFSIQPMHEEHEHESREPVVKIFHKDTDDTTKSEIVMGKPAEERISSEINASPSDYESDSIPAANRVKSKLSTACVGEKIEEGCCIKNAIKTAGFANNQPPRKCSSTDVNMSSSWTDMEAKYREVSSKCTKYQDMALSPEPDAPSDEGRIEKPTCLAQQSDQKVIDINVTTSMFKNAEIKDATDLLDNFPIESANGTVMFKKTEVNDTTTDFTDDFPIESDVPSLAHGMMVTAISSACHEISSGSAVSPEYLEDVTTKYQKPQKEVQSDVSSSSDQVQLTNEPKLSDLNIGEAKIGLKAKRKYSTGFTDSKILATSDKETEHVPKTDDIDSSAKQTTSSDSQSHDASTSKSKLQKHKETKWHSAASDPPQHPENKNELTGDPENEIIDQCKEKPPKEQNNSPYMEGRETVTDSMNDIKQETNKNEQSLIHIDSRERKELSKPLGKRNVLDKGDNTKKSRSRTRSKVAAVSTDLQENNSNDSKSMTAKVTSPDKEGVSSPSTKLIRQTSKLNQPSEDHCVTAGETDPADIAGFPLKKTIKNTNLLTVCKVGKKQVIPINRSSNLKSKQEERNRGFKSANDDKRNREATFQASISPLSKSIAFFPLTDAKPTPHHKRHQMKDHTKQRNWQPKPTHEARRSVSAAEKKLIDHKTTRFSNASVSAYPNEPNETQ